MNKERNSADRQNSKGYLQLEDGTLFEGEFFGSVTETSGEVVFNTGMVGYTESLTDPSYRGQILVLTYPLVGNYGVPVRNGEDDGFESDKIQVKGLVVSDYIKEYSHWQAHQSLGEWMESEGIPGLTGIDTRELTKTLREKGTMLGRIVSDPKIPFSADDPNSRNIVEEVTIKEVMKYYPSREAVSKGHSDNSNNNGRPQSESRPESQQLNVIVVDCGCKKSIIRELVKRGCEVMVVPSDYDLENIKCDGIMISNGPGDPAMCRTTIENVARILIREDPIPVAGICLGCQLLALAAGGRTYKLPYGHRSQNQPCRMVATERCRITSQNHGYAIDPDSLPEGWKVWYRNLNDDTVEGIRHVSLPFFAVQFHPEASPGPTDVADFFDLFLEVMLNGA